MSSDRPQFLLKRREGSTVEEFREGYLQHARLVLPWCVANGVRYYAQIYQPEWTSADARVKYPDINLSEWDAAAEMEFSGGEGGGFNRVGKRYYEDVILVDERRILFSAALEHTRSVERGSVGGERRVEIIRDGRPLVEGGEEWRRLWGEVEGRAVAGPVPAAAAAAVVEES